MGVVTGALSAIKRAAGLIEGLLPAPPENEAGPPDIDGRRNADLDPEDLRRVRRAEKRGKGGYR